METLTLARYYCEMSLMEMDLVSERGSLLASACLLMALITKDLGSWVGLPQYCKNSTIDFYGCLLHSTHPLTVYETWTK